MAFDFVFNIPKGLMIEQFGPVSLPRLFYRNCLKVGNVSHVSTNRVGTDEKRIDC